MIQNQDEFHGKDNGLDCAMDSGWWFLIQELLGKVNRYIYPELSRARPPMYIRELALIASDGTEDLTRLRWQFGVLLRTISEWRHSTWWDRVVRIFGIRAVAGHTALGFIEDDRLLKPLTYVEDDIFSCIAHNTKISYLSSIITNGIALGGDGITSVVRSQLPAFHMMDNRIQ